MSARFVEVPASAIRQRLAGAGFSLDANARGAEEVYVRSHNADSRYIIKVYSSLTRGADEVRGRGADAIRVVAILDTGKKTYPLFKSARVYRTGSVEAVLDRMIERAREAYAVCNAHRKKVR